MFIAESARFFIRMELLHGAVGPQELVGFTFDRFIPAGA
jgi:hypothetical protein